MEEIQITYLKLYFECENALSVGDTAFVSLNEYAQVKNDIYHTLKKNASKRPDYLKLVQLVPQHNG